VQREGARLFNALGRDVQILLKAKLTVEGVLPPAVPPAPDSVPPPLLPAPRTPTARRNP